MKLEQEMASIIKFVLDRAGGPSPYYWNVPQNFTVPAVYFPPPEMETGGETFLTYYVDYAWYIKLFHTSGQGAYALANDVALALRGGRNLIPLIAEDGGEISGEFVRVNDPEVKLLDDGVAQIAVRWRSRRPYNDTAAEKQKVVTVNADLFMKSGETISEAYATALERYAVPLNSDGVQP